MKDEEIKFEEIEASINHSLIKDAYRKLKPQ
jgi:hypothetical protein